LTDKEFLKGRWRTPYYGEITLSVNNSEIKGEGRVPEGSLLSLALLGSSSKTTYKKLILDGEIKGATAKYAIKIQRENSSLLASGEEKIEGLMLFYCEKKEIKVLEQDKESKRKIYTMTKVL